MVIEVGVAETISDLRSDAHYWILRSRGLIRVVILISTNVAQRIITMERWGDVPPTYPSHVGGPNLRLWKIQSVTLDRHGVVDGAPFQVPANLIFDPGFIPQGILIDDFQFPAHELTLFAGEYWGMLN
jgi:hypothetical protein